MLDLDAVAIMLVLAREGSLARASRALGIPRSTLTRRVETLEETLGVRLVERSPRHLRLTAAGRLLVQQGAPLVDAARQVEATLREGTQGRLRTAVLPGLGWGLLATILEDEDSAATDARYEVVYTDREVHPVRDDFDLVVSFARPTDGTLYCRSILRFSWRCLVAPSYLATRGAPLDALALAAHPCVALRIHGGVPPSQWPLRGGGSLRINPWLITTNTSAAVQLVAAGRGIGLLPDIPMESAAPLVPILPEIGAEGDVWVCMGQRLGQSPRGRRLLALVERARRLLQRPDRVRTGSARQP